MTSSQTDIYHISSDMKDLQRLLGIIGIFYEDLTLRVLFDNLILFSRYDAIIKMPCPEKYILIVNSQFDS